MGKLFKEGLELALSDHSDKFDYELHAEFVGSASIDEIQRADNKLTSIHGVDYITGIANNTTLKEASKTFKSDVSYHFANLGEQNIEIPDLPENVAISSLNVWKDVYALGTYALNNISENGAYAASLYDTGYSFAPMLDIALRTHGINDFLPLFIARMAPPGTPTNVEEVVDRIEQHMPDWLFAAFCGDEASRFLRYWVQCGLHKKIKLLGLPFLLEDFEYADSEELEVYTCQGFTTKAIDTSSKNKYAVFREMGYMMGNKITDDILKSDEENHTSQNHKLLLATYRQKSKDFEYEELAEAEEIRSNNPHLMDMMNQPAAAWQNPYLSV